MAKFKGQLELLDCSFLIYFLMKQISEALRMLKKVIYFLKSSSEPAIQYSEIQQAFSKNYYEIYCYRVIFTKKITNVANLVSMIYC